MYVLTVHFTFSESPYVEMIELKIFWIVVAVLGGIVLIQFVVIINLCKKRRKAAKQSAKSSAYTISGTENAGKENKSPKGKGL